jgi:hypothetical protein
MCVGLGVYGSVWECIGLCLMGLCLVGLYLMGLCETAVLGHSQTKMVRRLGTGLNSSLRV